jgi:hypothetical protein
MSVEYRTGFLAIKGLEFRPDVLRKGKELLSAEHIFNVKETHKSNVVMITGFCVRQGSISNTPYIVELQISQNRTVLSGHCNCQAGIDGQCKHTSGLVSRSFNSIKLSFICYLSSRYLNNNANRL